jgi:hypothetical protein
VYTAGSAPPRGAGGGGARSTSSTSSSGSSSPSAFHCSSTSACGSPGWEKRRRPCRTTCRRRHLRSAHIRAIYANAAQLLARAEASVGEVQQVPELRWTAAAYQRVVAEISDLEYLISSTSARAPSDARLAEFAELKRRVRDAVAKVDELDVLDQIQGVHR